MDVRKRLSSASGLTRDALVDFAVATLLAIPEAHVRDFRRLAAEAMTVYQNDRDGLIHVADADVVIAEGPLAGRWTVRCVQPALIVGDSDVAAPWAPEVGYAIATKGELQFRISFTGDEDEKRRQPIVVGDVPTPLCEFKLSGVRLGSTAREWPEL
jgi:hypothetical protein